MTNIYNTKLIAQPRLKEASSIPKFLLIRRQPRTVYLIKRLKQRLKKFSLYGVGIEKIPTHLSLNEVALILLICVQKTKVKLGSLLKNLPQSQNCDRTLSPVSARKKHISRRNSRRWSKKHSSTSRNAFNCAKSLTKV